MERAQPLSGLERHAFAEDTSAALAPEAAEEKELRLAQKLVWWVVILVAVGAMLVLIWQVLPPGFTLF